MRSPMASNRQIIASNTSDQYLWWKCMENVLMYLKLVCFIVFWEFVTLLSIFSTLNLCSNIMSNYTCPFLCFSLSFISTSALTIQIMTGDHGAAPLTPGNPTKQTFPLNETTASDGKQSGSHDLKKFMNELHSIHCKLKTLSLHISMTFEFKCTRTSMFWFKPCNSHNHSVACSNWTQFIKNDNRPSLRQLQETCTHHVCIFLTSGCSIRQQFKRATEAPGLILHQILTLLVGLQILTLSVGGWSDCIRDDI